MWLINVETRDLEEFFSSNTPPYVILSRTWEEEEVSYKQYVGAHYRHLKGYGKIDMTCRLAKQRGIAYAWVDTCCIDKSSSAELCEAINSMFRWYRERKCAMCISPISCRVLISELAFNSAVGQCTVEPCEECLDDD